MKDYFIYLKGYCSNLYSTCLFRGYSLCLCVILTETKDITSADKPFDITLEDFKKIKARDVNLFLGDYCSRYYKHTEKSTLIFENKTSCISLRKKSSLSTLFKFLYRNDQLDRQHNRWV